MTPRAPRQSNTEDPSTRVLQVLGLHLTSWLWLLPWDILQDNFLLIYQGSGSCESINEGNKTLIQLLCTVGSFNAAPVSIPSRSIIVIKYVNYFTIQWIECDLVCKRMDQKKTMRNYLPSKTLFDGTWWRKSTVENIPMSIDVQAIR